jgi:hypothetical protein
MKWGWVMREKKARKARGIVYGYDLAPRNREYRQLRNGQIIADNNRRKYQKVKKVLKNENS